MDRYLAGEEVGRRHPRPGPRAGGRARVASSRCSRSAADRRRGAARAARPRRRGLPLAAGAPAAGRLHPRRRAARPAVLRPGRARWWRRWSRRPPTRTSAGSAWCGCSPARCGPTRPCTCPVTSTGSPGTTSRATRTTTWTSGSAPLSIPLGDDPAARAGGCVAGDICAVGRLTRAETGDTLSAARTHPLVVEPWVMPDPLLPVAIRAATKSDEDKLGQARCSGWPPRTRRCGSSTTPRPTRSCSGRWARRTSTCCSTGCASRYGVHGRARAAAGAAARDVRRAGHRTRPARQAERRPRPVRRVRHRGRAAAARRGLRVRRQGGRRRRCRGSSSPASRRACGPSSSGAASPATRWSTSG